MNYPQLIYFEQPTMICKTQGFIKQCLAIRYNYISKKALDQIEKNHGKTAFQRTLMYSKQAHHIAKQGFFSFKNDLQQYFKILMIQKVEKIALTAEQEALKRKIKQDIGRLKPIVLINILPFSGPLLIFYILTYPTKVPSYFCLDELYDLHQLDSVQKQKQAIQHFKNNPIERANFSLITQTLDELKLLSQLLFGHFEDGVVGINKYFKNNPKTYFLHPRFSKHFVIRKIKQELKKDVIQHKELENLSTEQLILWKYDRVMKGQDKVVFKPIANPQQLIDTISVKIEANAQIKKQEGTNKPKQYNHTRHDHAYRQHPKIVEHDRIHHKSQTRKNK